MTQPARILWCAVLAASLFLLPMRANAQSATVTDDAFLSTSKTTQAFNLNGQGVSLVVAGSSAAVGSQQVGTTKTFIKFQLQSSLPPTVAAANVAKATLKLYLSPLTTPSGAIDIYPVTSAWTESTLTTAPPTVSSTAFATGIAVGNANSFLVVDLTQLVKEWLNGSANGGLANDGIALEADTSTSYVVFDSKESIVTSHEPRLEIVLANSGPQGPAGPAGAQGATGATGPAGAAGPAGQAATIKIEPTAMTVPYGTPASVMNGGPPTAADLTFLIPQGAPGAPGLPGTTGPQGPAGIKNQGNWVSGNAYNPSDAVSYNNSFWMATVADNGSQPPSSNPNWQLLAAGINNRGAWSSGNSYSINDGVTDGGSFWLAIAATTSSTSCKPAFPPDPCSADWQLLSAAGAQGPTGAQGPQGIQGPMGLPPANTAITTLANTFSMDQTITGNLTIGGTGNGIKFPDGTSLTTGSTNSATGANPRMIASAFMPGALNAPYTAATFTPDLDITLTRVTAQIKTAADASCTPAVLRVGNSTAAQDLVLVSSQNTIDSGAMSLPLSANGAVSVKIQTGAVCSAGSTPSDANVLLEYRMQSSGDTTSCASSGQVCTTGGVGVCKLTQSDVNNCGACGNVCPSNAACNQGNCSSPKSTTSLAYPLFNPSGFSAGQSVTISTQLGFSAPSGVPAPTGSVTFLDGGTILGTASLSSVAANTMTAQFTIQAITAGTHSFTVQYAGDSNYSGSTSTATNVTVN